jgi:hypothetical protein
MYVPAHGTPLGRLSRMYVYRLLVYPVVNSDERQNNHTVHTLSVVEYAMLLLRGQYASMCRILGNAPGESLYVSRAGISHHASDSQ